MIHLAAWTACLLTGFQSTQPLERNGVVQGVLATPGERDTFTFEAKNRDWYQLRLVDTDKTSFRPRIEVFDPHGELVQSSVSEDVALIDPRRVTGPTQGTYTVVVSDDSSASFRPADYGLHFVLAPGEGEGGELMDGVTVIGRIDRGDLDSYTMTLPPGPPRTLRGTLRNLTPGSLTMSNQLFRDNGLAGTGTGNTFQFQITTGLSIPPTTTVFTIVVADGSETATGTGLYSLVVDGLPTPAPAPPNRYLESQFRGLDPLLIDNGGHPGLGPRIGDAAEPFNVSLDCRRASRPSFWSLWAWSDERQPISTPFGWLYLGGTPLFSTSGRHRRSIETWFPPSTGRALPADASLVGRTYTVQGICGGDFYSRGAGLGFYFGPALLSGALTQTIRD